MLQAVTRSMFLDAFARLRPDNFTNDALSALYDYLEEVDPGMYLDVIAICCDYSQYSSAVEAAQDMDWERPSHEEDVEETAAKWIADRSELILVEDGSVVVGNV